MISIIVAYANRQVIGKDGGLPWHLPDDLRYFKRTTSGHTIVMGRNTFASIGRPLPQRRNIVLSHNIIDMPGIETVDSVEKILALDDVFIIGGEHVYRQFLQYAERLYITEIAADIAGDVFFPAWERADFTLISAQEGILDEKNTLPHTFYIYERKKSQV